MLIRKIRVICVLQKGTRITRMQRMVADKKNNNNYLTPFIEFDRFINKILPQRTQRIHKVH